MLHHENKCMSVREQIFTICMACSNQCTQNCDTHLYNEQSYSCRKILAWLLDSSFHPATLFAGFNKTNSPKVVCRRGKHSLDPACASSEERSAAGTVHASKKETDVLTSPIRQPHAYFL
ncbi:hypothetical protein IscW_ISCW020340 [Ixodes scapularis]|uniref:Uncharacterized protein n=1 Tax=Ixodes scapularis TaxID=6945 RepID=B7PY03_IXOSC|nr:hypothetical protein IscW_ISCW020340 [Ixodes scapularis]|eukprot:XP_002402291.1 hypothetical protein IscW_ISCW020340 [Ixodes scapularis]